MNKTRLKAIEKKVKPKEENPFRLAVEIGEDGQDLFDIDGELLTEPQAREKYPDRNLIFFGSVWWGI